VKDFLKKDLTSFIESLSRKRERGKIVASDEWITALLYFLAANPVDRAGARYR